MMIYVFKMIHSVLKMMNFVLKMMHFVLKMMHFELKMMKFAGGAGIYADVSSNAMHINSNVVHDVADQRCCTGMCSPAAAFARRYALFFQEQHPGQEQDESDQFFNGIILISY